MDYKIELMKTSLISIIIPTTRPENETLESFFQFEIPNGFKLEYFFIIDEPSKKVDNLMKLVKKYPQFRVEIIRNETNLGTSESRNIGIERSHGDFILSLDDDCILKPTLIKKYIEALKKNPECPGFIGLTNAPRPINSFEKAICLSDMRHFFEIAKHKQEFYWGITANLFIKRESIEDNRFSLDHPKKGGGEDIAFCLEILKNYSNNHQGDDIKFKCVPEAEVVHPFWKENFNGYKRFFRWGYGDVILHKKYPENRYHQFPNLIEFIFMVSILNILIFGWVISLLDNFLNFFWLVSLLFLIILLAIFIWEILCEAFKLNRNNRKFGFIPLVKAVIIRQLNDLGRFIHQLPKIWKITCRWDYFCSGESLKYETKTAAMKFLGFIVIYCIIIIITISLLNT